MPFRVERSTITILVILAILLCGATYAAYLIRKNAAIKESALAQIQQGEALPYTDLNGNTFDLEKFRGTILVVNAWASWSPYSKDELQMLSNIALQYKDQIQVVAMNRMEPVPNAKAFIEYVGNPSGITFLIDPKDTFYSRIGGYAMPETVVYNKKGNVVVHHQGVLMREQLEAYIKTAVTAVE